VSPAGSSAGLILAAGESRRMGSPKALLPYRGETFLDTLAGLLAVRCTPVIVVLGAGAGEIRTRVTRPATFVVNPDFKRGQTSSMQCGLRAVPAHARGVLFTLVDHPAVASSTIDTLLAEPRPMVRVPRYQGRRGHPIWFSRELIAEFLALPETGAARDLVHSHAAETEYLDVDDPGIVADIDGVEDYRKLTGAGA
jgi:molybdenum cofactor cytidylyltransferase